MAVIMYKFVPNLTKFCLCRSPSWGFLNFVSIKATYQYLEIFNDLFSFYVISEYGHSGVLSCKMDILCGVGFVLVFSHYSCVIKLITLWIINKIIIKYFNLALKLSCKRKASCWVLMALKFVVNWRLQYDEIDSCIGVH